MQRNVEFWFSNENMEFLCLWVKIDLHQTRRIPLLNFIISLEYVQNALSFMVGDAIEYLLWLQQISTVCFSRWNGWISCRCFDYPLNGWYTCWCWWQAGTSTNTHFPMKSTIKIYTENNFIFRQHLFTWDKV